MLPKKDNLVSTSYNGEAATEYDAWRFTTRQGLLFAKFEFEELERVIAKVPQNAYVLEVGCGTARFSKYLAEKGYCVQATDPSLDMIRVASEKCTGLDNISFRREEGADLSFATSTFGFVFSIRVTNHTGSREYALRMIREMIRVAKPGGLILVEFVNSQKPFRRKSKDVRLSFAQIAKLAYENNCCVESQRGILVFPFPRMILNNIPENLIPVWAVIEQLSARILWKYASRGYILLRKQLPSKAGA